MKDVTFVRHHYLTYSSLYDDYDSFEVKRALENIPTVTALERISYLLNSLSFTGEKDKSIHQFTLLKWVLSIAGEDNRKVSQVIQDKDITSNPDFRFINVAASLMLLEYLLENNNLSEQRLTKEQESKLFKAYLWCTEESLSTQEEAYNYSGNESIDELLNIILPAKLRYREVGLHKDYRIQFIKIFYFFKFCESDTQYGQYLTMFLKEYKLDTWDKYLLLLLDTYLRLATSNEKTPKINIPPSNTEIVSFLDSFSLKNHDCYSRSADYTTIRTHPVYKQNDNYIFLNFNFFIDKLYQGFLFDFVKILRKNECKVSTYPGLKSDLGKKFSESVVFYKTMDLCFKNYTNVRLSGDDIKEAIGSGEPDFYMRHGRKVFLFEFKDATLSKEVKHSNDIDKIKKKIISTFEETDSKKRKGVRQLIYSIKLLHDSAFNTHEIDLYDPQNITIYPIIVHTDSSFEVEGVNFIIKERFKQILLEENIKNQHQIKDVILVNVDTLMALQDFFQNNELKLSTSINHYLDYSNAKGKKLNKFYSFDSFLKSQAYKKGYRNLATSEFLRVIDKLASK